MRTRSDQLIGFWLAIAVLLQAVLLAAAASMTRAQAVEFFLGAVCLMLLVIWLWRVRLYLNSHVDMILIMCASGGLGMLLGLPMPSHMGHAVGAAAWWRMCTGMFALGLTPAIAFTRCLRTARRLHLLAKALLIDSAGMLVGMWLSSFLRIGEGDRTMIVQHFTMLGGMTVGMLAGMWTRSAWLLAPRSQNRERVVT
jgi:hypothetical protein